MTRSQISRSIVQAILRRSLSDIRRDPQRTVRMLVDLGREAAVGPSQQAFLRTAQKMLQRKESPYYTMIQNTARSVDDQRLLTFGMALGWNSLTQGVSRIRTCEQRLHCSIPWSLTFHMAQSPGHLSGQDYFDLVRDGMELGICSYFLFVADAESLLLGVKLAETYPESAFCLFLPQGLELHPWLSPLLSCWNLMVGVNCGGHGWERQVWDLRDRGSLYLLWRGYHSRQAAAEICSGQWARDILPYAGPVTLLVSQGQEAAVERAVRHYALNTRLKQRYPTLILDYYSDILYTDRCISHTPRFVGILPDGTVTTYQKGRELPAGRSIRSTALADVLAHLN